ncbi:DUF2695 domain-containing protein [Actinokineospora auranticolor]|uniref:Uncharacterized protein DUF2695 n=1 Tax=Actinokineospora auranticolor TaxID=155976 RepID=A0A2S6GNP4_9PSEU|nr:DUF2695 domain-containing protein [Actinokineospora auranticolor]PPK66854.1 uncharacterized protein DUF2695 [Actinokineospora auranticolor]
MPSREERKRLKDEYLRAEHKASRERMVLDLAQLDSLVTSVEASVAEHGCDHTLHATIAWAEERAVDLESLMIGLEDQGAYCDCEVVMNIDPEDIFGPVRERPTGA